MNEATRQGDRGAVMVELAFVLVVLVIIVLGFVEIGRALYQENTLTKAVESGARYLARAHGVLDLDPDNLCAVKAPPAGEETWSEAQSTARKLVVYGNTAGAGSPLVPGLDPGDVSIDVAAGSEACIIRVRAVTRFSGIFGDTLIPALPFGIGPIQTPSLNASTEERYIGE